MSWRFIYCRTGNRRPPTLFGCQQLGQLLVVLHTQVEPLPADILHQLHTVLPVPVPPTPGKVTLQNCHNKFKLCLWGKRFKINLTINLLPWYVKETESAVTETVILYSTGRLTNQKSPTWASQIYTWQLYVSSSERKKCPSLLAKPRLKKKEERSKKKVKLKLKG